jgi:hypothetical protein
MHCVPQPLPPRKLIKQLFRFAVKNDTLTGGGRAHIAAAITNSAERSSRNIITNHSVRFICHKILLLSAGAEQPFSTNFGSFDDGRFRK